MRTYSVVELENMIRVAVGSGFEKLPLGEVISLNASFEYFYESNETNSAEDFVSLEQLNLQSSEKRTSLEEIEEILQTAVLNPFKINETKYLCEAHRIAASLSQKAQSIADYSSVYKLRSRLDPLRRKLNWNKVCGFLQALSKYPVELPGSEELLSVVNHVMTWRQEVLSFTTSKSESSEQYGSNKRQSRRVAGRDGGKDKKPVPIKRVEALLSEGERFPFFFHEEMNILKERKDQTKLWLDKLKKSISAPKRSVNIAESSDSKLSLEEMKMMVTEGKSLYQQMDDIESDSKGIKAMNKDLNKASSVVEAAEDWILRFQETFSAQVDHDLSNVNNSIFWQSATAPSSLDVVEMQEVRREAPEAADVELTMTDEERVLQSRKELIKVLQDLLLEADSMPIAIEEAEGIRGQLQALEWANKNRSSLMSLLQTSSPTEASRSTRLRFSEIQQLKNEITK
jgi:hypothetical protein